jgi:hypothetical protein
LYEISYILTDTKNNLIVDASYGYITNTNISNQSQTGGVTFGTSTPTNYTAPSYSFQINSGTIDSSYNGSVLLNNLFSSNIYNTGNLYVGGNTNLSNQLFVNDVSNNVDISGNLTVSALQIGFDPPGIPTGDNAYIEYLQTNGTKSVLRINVNTDGLGSNNDDNINLNPTGGVGIKTDNPQYELDVSGNCNVSGNTTIQQKLDLGTLGTLGLNLLNRIYPIGTIYMNYENSFNPNHSSLLGFGSWTIIPAGYNFAAYENGSTFGTLGGTGGSANVSNTFTPSGTVVLGSHNHFINFGNGDIIGRGDDRKTTTDETDLGTKPLTMNSTTIITNTYSPYMVVAMWRRTA